MFRSHRRHNPAWLPRWVRAIWVRLVTVPCRSHSHPATVLTTTASAPTTMITAWAVPQARATCPRSRHRKLQVGPRGVRFNDFRQRSQGPPFIKPHARLFAFKFDLHSYAKCPFTVRIPTTSSLPILFFTFFFSQRLGGWRQLEWRM